MAARGGAVRTSQRPFVSHSCSKRSQSCWLRASRAPSSPPVDTMAAASFAEALPKFEGLERVALLKVRPPPSPLLAASVLHPRLHQLHRACRGWVALEPEPEPQPQPQQWLPAPAPEQCQPEPELGLGQPQLRSCQTAPAADTLFSADGQAIESESGNVFEQTVLAAVSDEALRSQMRAVVLESNMAGLEEFGPLWFDCIKSKMERMTLCADWVALALEQLPSGFDEFERALITGASNLLPSYHQYYLDYLATVQDAAVVAALKASPPPTSREDVHSSYTAVSLDAGGGFVAQPIATQYATALAPVLTGFDSWIEACTAANAALEAEGSAATEGWDAVARISYIEFLTQYRTCLASKEEPVALEAAWTELDHKWMATKMPIQLVHEYARDTSHHNLIPGDVSNRLPDTASRLATETLCAARPRRTTRFASSTRRSPKRIKLSLTYKTE